MIFRNLFSPRSTTENSCNKKFVRCSIYLYSFSNFRNMGAYCNQNIAFSNFKPRVPFSKSNQYMYIKLRRGVSGLVRPSRLALSGNSPVRNPDTKRDVFLFLIVPTKRSSSRAFTHSPRVAITINKIVLSPEKRFVCEPFALRVTIKMRMNEQNGVCGYVLNIWQHIIPHIFKSG